VPDQTLASTRWPYVAEPVTAQVFRLVEGFQQILGQDLLAVYLHGSLALGGFRPPGSDIDLLVLTQSPLGASASRALAELALAQSLKPCPLEFHVLCLPELTPWQHPAPFAFHYSEAWRERVARALACPGWEDGGGRDPDLAAHLMVTRLRGVPLVGPPPEQLLPGIPATDFLQSVLGDLRWALSRFERDPVYAVLNACRVLAFLCDGTVLSKEEAVPWALRRLPAETHPALCWVQRLRRGAVPREARP